MPRLFISYARADLDIVKKIEQALVENGVTVWCDQESLYGGQKWPKALAEEIASHDHVLLVWSKSSAKSHFVEFEWTTALALKKTILPFLIDDIPLSPSLSGISTILLKNFDQDLSEILRAIRKSIPKSSRQQSTQVIKKLEQIAVTEPEKVVQMAKRIFVQEGWSVQGSLYQAAGDIHVSITQPSVEGSPKKSLLARWQAWVVLLTAIVTLVTMLLELPQKIWTLLNPSSESTLVEDEIIQPLSGVVKDEDGNPLPGVVVILPEYNLTDTTNWFGKFEFQLKAPKQVAVSLIAQIEDYMSYSADPTLGNTSYNFVMRKPKE